MKKLLGVSLLSIWIGMSLGALWYFEAREALFATICSIVRK